jgi:hypothetical protein
MFEAFFNQFCLNPLFNQNLCQVKNISIIFTTYSHLTIEANNADACTRWSLVNLGLNLAPRAYQLQIPIMGK